MHLDRGLGDPWSDYDLLTLRADLYPPLKGCVFRPCFSFSARERVTNAFPGASP